VVVTGFRGLWALEWAWHIRVTKLALRIKLRNLNLKSQFSIFDSFRDIHVHIYDFLKFVGGLWALGWARLVILIKNIYTLWGRKRFLLPVKYFLTNLVYPFTLRVTGIINSASCTDL